MFRSMSFLFAYLLPLRGRVSLLTVSILLGVILTVINPQLIRHFLDIAQLGGEWNQLVLSALSFIVLSILIQANQVLSVYWGDKLGWMTTNQLKRDALRHVLGLDSSFHNQHRSGDLLERLEGDCNNLFTFFSQFLFQIVSSSLLLVGVIAMLFAEHWLMGTAILIFSVVTLSLLVYSRVLVIKPALKEREASTDYYGYMEEGISGARDIRRNGATAYVLGVFRDLHHQLYKASRKSWIRSRLSVWGTSVLLIAAGNVITFTISIALYRSGEITIGTVFLFFYYTELIFKPLEQITYQLQYLHGATASMNRLRLLLSTQAGSTGDLDLADPIQHIEFCKVSFRYDAAADANALTDIDLRLDRGKVLGLLGRTGSGKSTIVKLLSGQYHASEGIILINGVDIRMIREASLLHKIAYVTQDVQLFEGTIRDNITFFDRAYTDAELLDVIAHLGLDVWFDRLPHGLDTEVKGRGEGLSAGEGQLISFIRIFLKNPDVVVLDEYSSRLDPFTERLLDEAVDRLFHNRTGIIIAHRIRTVQKADQIMILSEGRIVEYGSAKQLEENPCSRYFELLDRGQREASV